MGVFKKKPMKKLLINIVASIITTSILMIVYYLVVLFGAIAILITWFTIFCYHIYDDLNVTNGNN